MKFSDLLVESNSIFIDFVEKQAKANKAIECKVMHSASEVSDVISITFEDKHRPDDKFKTFFDFLETRFEYLKFKNTGRNKGHNTVIFSITVEINQRYFQKYCNSINKAVDQMEV